MATIESDVDNNVSRLEKQLDGWSAQLDQLVVKADLAAEKAMLEARKGLAGAKIKLEAARSMLVEAKAAGRDQWKTFELKIETAWKDVDAALQAASAS